MPDLPDLTSYDDDTLDNLRIAVLTEQARRAILSNAPEQAANLASRYWDASGREDGQSWVQPQGAHDAVPFGRTVTHNDKEWRSKHHANVWEPSASSPWWEEVVVGDPGPQPWALDVYYTPPTKVTFEDNIYECTFEHLSQVGWEPNNPTMHAVWKLAEA